MTQHWRRLSSRYLYESQWYNVRQDQVALPGGTEITYTSIEHDGYVVAVPLFDDGRVLMERVYRYTLGQDLFECPSGGLDGPDEVPEHAAARELEEETGYRAGRVVRLGTFFGSSGISNETFHVCLATELSSDGTIDREETEQIEIEFHQLSELVTAAKRGEIADAPSALAVILAANHVSQP